MKTLVFSLFAVLITATTVLAATIVEPGGSIIVAQSKDAISDEKTTSGRAFVDTDEDGLNRLFFIAPDVISREPVKVSYKLNGEAQETEFQVLEGAAVFGSDVVYEASFKALFIVFILAVVIESGLQLIFRWRPYLRVFNTSGTNALVAFGFSLFFVSFFELDIASRLVNAYVGTPNGFNNSIPGYALTAMIVAGGSAGVNRLFRTFGIRPVGLPPEIAGPVEQKDAWVSVSINRKNAKGSIKILLGEPGKEAVIGTINGSSDGVRNVRKMFFRDKGRFPSSGGYRIDANAQPRVIKIVASDALGNEIPVEDWGPHPIGSRAIIDIVREI